MDLDWIYPNDWSYILISFDYRCMSFPTDTMVDSITGKIGAGQALYRIACAIL